ncbi:uncharacterized protein LOC125091434 [Lutra lutra]|uniref:uncharacterized protein LOC125091434 n=1 Tax=Lutra lutra TaxID=9657 RepID=UPI001FD3C299|nr:uncharacterized protein LOC125091434 [Lutra lutra]
MAVWVTGFKTAPGRLKPPTHPRLPSALPGTWARSRCWATRTRPSRPPPQRGARGEGGLRRRKPLQAVPTALGEPARIARGALRGPEGRVLEEGRPEPQSGNANSALRPGPSLEGNGSPFVSRRRTHQPAHRPEKPRVQGRASNRHRPLSLNLTPPASPRVCLTTTLSPGLASLSLGLVPSSTACTRPWMQVIQSSRKDCTQESHLAKN